MTLDAQQGNSYTTVSLVLNENTNIQVQGERYTTVAAATAASATRGTDGAFVHSVGLSDTVTLTVGSNSVFISNASYSGNTLAYAGTAARLLLLKQLLKLLGHRNIVHLVLLLLLP